MKRRHDDRQTDIQTYREIKTERQRDIQTDIHTYRQRDKNRLDIQSNRQTER